MHKVGHGQKMGYSLLSLSLSLSLLLSFFYVVKHSLLQDINTMHHVHTRPYTKAQKEMEGYSIDVLTTFS
jgi:hypothetical protein